MVIVLLSVALTTALALLTFIVIQLVDANVRITEQRQEIDEQDDIIEKKETFGAAMNDLLATAGEFDGVLMNGLVPMSDYEAIAQRAWQNRRNLPGLDGDIAEVRVAISSLKKLTADAAEESATNVTGTEYEAVIDNLGAGFVTSLIDNADDLCDDDVLACVSSDDPYTVHFDARTTHSPT